jgi:hypothetical protein
MQIEQEAAAFTEGKRTQFNMALSDYLAPLIEFLDDNLHMSTELDDIKYHLLVVKLMCRHSAELHGIK